MDYENLFHERMKRTELSISLSLIRQAVERLWQFQPVIQDFTKHDLGHSIRVINYLGRLLECNTGGDLTEEELYVLLSATYLHDIGMQCDVKEVQLECGLDLQKGPEGYTRDQQSKIREKHACLMSEWINSAFKQGAQETRLKHAVLSIPKPLVPVIIDVARNHSGTDWRKCPQSFITSDGGEQRRLFLSLLLRLADELDIGENRVDIDTVQQYSLPPKHALVWWLHYFTTIYVDVAQHMISFQLTLNDKDVDLHGDHVSKIVVSKFHDKNQSIVEELSRRGIHILISRKPLEIVRNPAFPRLPPEIAELLFQAAKKEFHDGFLANIDVPRMQRIRETFVTFDFRHQVRLYKQVLDRNISIAAFLVCGPASFGQGVLVRRLSRFLPVIGNARYINLTMTTSHLRHKIEYFWGEVAKELQLSCQEKPERIAEKLCQCWMTQDIVIVIDHVDYPSQDIIRRLIEQFWQLLFIKAHEQVRSGQPSTHLFMFLVDRKGSVGSSTLRFAEDPDQLKENWHPLRLPPIQHFPENELDSLLSSILEFLPQDVQASEVLSRTDNGVPELVYERICDLAGIPWEGDMAL